MNPKEIQTILSRCAEEAFPPETVHLWPEVQRSLEKGSSRTQIGESSMPPQTAHKTRLAALAGLSLLILLGVTLLTPSGRALAQDLTLRLTRFFTRLEGNTFQVPTQEPRALVPLQTQAPASLPASPVPATDPAALPGALPPFYETCASLISPTCSIEQIQQLVNFPIQSLLALPSGFAFSGASGGPDQVVLQYRGERGALYLAQSPRDREPPEIWQIAQDALVESLTISSYPAEYVRGGWSGLGLDETGQVGWESQDPRQTLRWEQDGVRYTLVFLPARIGDEAPLKKQALADLAASLSKPAPSETALLPLGLLTLEQAGRIAGFEAVEPGWLPDGYRLIGASVAPDFGAVCLHYRYRQEIPLISLTIFQTRLGLPGLEALKVKAEANGQPVEIPVSIASLPVDGAWNGAATLASNGVTLTPLCGGPELPTNQILLWRAEQTGFALGAQVDQFHGRGFLTRRELQRIAASLNGSRSADAVEPDPERLTSLADVKALAEEGLSFQVRLPGRMLSDLHFDHAVILSAGDPANPYYGYEQNERLLLIYLGAPLGDGRYQNLFLSQVFGPENPSLEDLALAGGYRPAQVNGLPALVRQDCWQDDLLGGPACMHMLTWIDDGVWIEMNLLLDRALTEDQLIAIAESLR